ncbi:Protein CBG15595 [Caenorhabditis briggsae]|uniref:Protein CBG15595 n=1 Tax=Caenorhabditis briggsae TaxID=6238 RepID=A8XMD6_CAEBR|nr:Protein CBG15595 [Caenorhabditis briggsae]CAP33811.2 Protein CBG15595 [Caenorhabditis briggsae]
MSRKLLEEEHFKDSELLFNFGSLENRKKYSTRKVIFSTTNYTNPTNVESTVSQYNDDCKIPQIDPWDYTVIPFLDESDKTKNCNRTWKPYTELAKGKWKIVTKEQNLTCKASLVCHTWTSLKSPVNITDWFPPGPTDCEFLETACWKNKTEEAYGYIHTQIRPKNLEKPKIRKEDHPDVFVFLVDSVATGMARRSLPKTLGYLKTKFKAVEFPFVSPVAARSQVNAVPLWFGKQVEAGTQKGGKTIKVDWTEEEYCKTFLDNRTDMFREFEKIGYKTAYIDDWSSQTLTNNPDCKGFQNFYTTHNFNLFNKIWDYTGLKITKKHLNGQFCREVHQSAMEYFEQFAEAYSDDPKFSWNWFVHLAHSHLSGADRMDTPMVDMFRRNMEKVRPKQL